MQARRTEVPPALYLGSVEYILIKIKILIELS
jgi:hypothetical protein